MEEMNYRKTIQNVSEKYIWEVRYQGTKESRVFGTERIK